VPLIDVIFCILTFFLLAGLQVARQQAISVDIPKASSGTPAARELLMVSLSDAGQLFLEQQPMAPGQLIEAVKQYRQARPNSSIVLYASKQVTYNKVVEVLDALRGVAGDRVALATLPANTTAPTPPILPPPGYYPYTPSPGGATPYNPAQGVNPTTTPPSVATPPTGITPPTQATPNVVTPPTGITPPTQATPTTPSQTPATTPTTPTPSKSPTATPTKSP
ncbi:biopolymer transporter ExbD, partial [Chamaesiphon sp. OTE_8_metabat_110]